jgi:hypothetical protein
MAIPRAVRQAARALRDLWTHGCNTTWSVTCPSLNEIRRWSESSAKDESLIPADRVQGQFNERVHTTMCTLYSRQATTLWVASILTSQVQSVRDMIERVGGIHKVPAQGGLELLLQTP